MGLIVVPRRTLRAAAYYVRSVLTLLFGVSFWRLPLLLLRRPVRISTRNSFSFYVASFFDVWLLKEVVLDHDYDRRRPLQAQDTVIDVGAGIGDFSVLAGATADQVFAFEAAASRVKLARRNIKLNRRDNVRLQHLNVTSLDRLLDDYEIAYCDFLKIDCEGCEYQVLNTASPAALERVGYIAMEAHLMTPLMREQYRRLTDHLRAAGFHLAEAPNPVHSYIKFLFASR